MRVLLTFISAALLTTAAWIIWSAPAKHTNENTTKTQPIMAKANPTVKEHTAIKLQEKKSLSEVLTEYFGSRIQSTNSQMELYSLRLRLFSDNENLTPSQFNTALSAAFPTDAKTLLQLFDNLDTYNAWLNSELSWLDSLENNIRLGELWKKRYALFGTQANEIWSDERQSLSEKRQQYKLVLAELDADQSISLDEKLYQLNLRTQELIEDEFFQFTKPETLVYQSFFKLDSVQKTLANLTAEKRQEQINSIRRQLGFTEQQIDSLATEDRIRNQRWERGLFYMQRRQALIDAYPEAELDRALDALRTEVFGFEAETIKREEAEGFFRYNRPRVYGRNS